jgi:hypothetical protein
VHEYGDLSSPILGSFFLGGDIHGMLAHPATPHEYKGIKVVDKVNCIAHERLAIMDPESGTQLVLTTFCKR